MQYKKYIYLLFTLILFFIFPQKASAAFSFNISSPSATLITSGSQEIDVSLNITDLPSESYFRVSLQKDTGGSYYGYVQNNNNEWAKIQTLGGDCTGYFKVTDLKTSLINLKYKIGDDIALDNGNYVLKSHKFTKACSSYTDSVNTIVFTVSLPTPTPTQQPTNPPTQVPTQAPTTSPTKSPSPVPTKSPSPKPTPTESPTQEPTETPFDILIDNNSTQKPEQIEAKVLGDSTTKKKLPLISYLFISLGFGFLGYVGYMLYNMKNAKNKENI